MLKELTKEKDVELERGRFQQDGTRWRELFLEIYQDQEGGEADGMAK